MARSFLHSVRTVRLLVLIAMCASLAIFPSVSRAADLANQYTWKQLKIGAGGFVTGMAVHPTSGTVYVRTDVGGAYRWNETTQIWTQLILDRSVPNPRFNSGADYNVESIAISAKDDQAVYVAVGADGNDATTGTGRILKSMDRGQTWSDNGQRWIISGNGDYRTGGERLIVDPNNTNVLFFGTRREGLWTSTNGGTTWTQVATGQIPIGDNATGTKAGVKFVLFDGDSAVTNGRTSRIYAGVAGQGVYRSDDAGATWTRILSTTGIPYDAKVMGGTLYLGVVNANGVSPFQKYDPAANTWTNIAPSTSGNYWSFAIDPFNPQRIFAGADGIKDGNFFRSTDGGTSWTTLNIAVSSPDIPWITTTDEENYMTSASLKFDPLVRNRLWFPQGIGVWRTSDLDDGETTWVFTSKGIEEKVATDLVAPPGGAPVSTVYDRQGFYHANPDAYPTRPLVDNQFWGGTSVSYSGGAPNELVTVQAKNNYYPALTGRGAYSSDNGRNWTLFQSAPDGAVGGNVAVSATDPTNIVWLGSTGNFGQGTAPSYTTNRGNTWAKSAGYSGTNTHWLFWWGFKRALDADKVEGGTFYLVTFDGDGEFYVSRDGGANFQKAANAPNCSTANDCHVFGQLHTVPGKAGHVWSSAVKGGLYYTTDAGATAWTKVSGVEEARSFGFGKAIGGANYPAVYVFGTVGGQQGLFRSADQGATWDKLATAPAGIYDSVNVVNGDMNVAGRVYVGFGGNGFVYGDDTSLPAEPTATPPTSTPTVTPSPTPTNEPGNNTVLVPIADRYGDANSGTQPYINVSRWSLGYVKFDLRSLTGAVQRATLRLYRTNNDNGSTDLSAYQYDNNWSETEGSLTNPITTPAINSVPAISSGVGWVEIDVTDWIATQAAGDGVASMVLQGTTNGWVGFNSREAATNQPQLVVQTALPPTATPTNTPADTPTATSSPTATPAPNSNIALGRPAFASSTEGSDYAASNVTDGNIATRWASEWSDPQWIVVDLQATQRIREIRINWEQAFARRYDVQTSTNGVKWTTIESRRRQTSGGVHVISNLNANARYIRILCKERATSWGYSIWEIEAFK